MKRSGNPQRAFFLNMIDFVACLLLREWSALEG
jgi:hypothetical protein